MDLQCDERLGCGYRGSTQKTRVISEGWLASQGFCLACTADSLCRLPHNSKARDFLCLECGHAYELKSTRMQHARKWPDGAYGAMMQRINDGTMPTVLLMSYGRDWRVIGLTAIHRLFLTSAVIEKRKPLSASARRAGWVGCNIAVSGVPPEGLIPLVDQGIVIKRTLVRERFRAVAPLAGLSPADRSWTSLTLLAIRELPSGMFSLADLYSKEKLFAEVYPNNRNIRPKIRQQLQVLRDSGLVEFEGKGRYRLTHS